MTIAYAASDLGASLLAGYWSITIRANWRIIFRFEENEATDVDLVDYP